jgi:hypothetical protein
MPNRKPGPTTPAEIAAYGHIAAALREYLKRTGKDIADLNQAIGNERSHTAPYIWLNCKGGPGPANRIKLAKLLGCKPDDLAAKVRSKAPDGLPVKHEVGPPRTATGAAWVAPRRADALSFVVTPTGEAHIKIDITLPLTEGSALLRMLLDAGAVFSWETKK